MRTRVIVLAGTVLVCALLVACGGTAEPSPEPSGALIQAEQEYVSDIRSDGEIVSDGIGMLDQLLAEYPDYSPSTVCDTETSISTLESLHQDWSEREIPSSRLSRARSLWLNVLSHTRDALAALATDADLSASTAEMGLGGRNTTKLADELDRLEAL